MKTYRKSELGELRTSAKTRAGHLAYAMLRGVPYRVVEPKTRELTAYQTRKLAVAVALTAMVDGPDVPSSAVDTSGGSVAGNALRDEVLAWLAVPEAPERRTWREAREAASQVKRQAAREAHRAKNAAMWRYREEVSSQERISAQANAARVAARVAAK